MGKSRIHLKLKRISQISGFLLVVVSWGVYPGELQILQSGEKSELVANVPSQDNSFELRVRQAADNSAIRLELDSGITGNIDQTGSNSLINLNSSGGEQLLSLFQSGISNVLNLNLTGSTLNTSVSQTGVENRLTYSANGNNNQASLEQSGSNNTLQLSQTGAENEANLTQGGSNNTLDVSQRDGSLNVSVTQTGTGEQIVIR